jgi:hypothetical protein
VPDARFPLPKIAGQDYDLKGLGGYLQPAGPMRQLAGLAAIPRKGDGMAGKRDLDPGASPLHFFGAEVRRSREAAGMTLAGLGAAVPCDASTVSRVESGQLSPTERFAESCDEAFPQMGGWFARFYRASLKWDGPYPRWFEDWVDAERRAAVIRWWEPLLVPGLLQTPEYARALFRAWRTDDDEDKIVQLVTARMDRQRIFDRPGPPSFWAVLDEGVLRRGIGGAKVMHDQLVHLADMGQRASIKIHVIPAEAARTWGCWGLSPSRAWPATRRVSSTSSHRTKGRPAGTRARWLRST